MGGPDLLPSAMRSETGKGLWETKCLPQLEIEPGAGRGFIRCSLSHRFTSVTKEYDRNIVGEP